MKPIKKVYAKKGRPPSHPGEVLREMFIKERGLTITEVAKGLRKARTNLSSVVNEKASISPN